MAHRDPRDASSMTARADWAWHNADVDMARSQQKHHGVTSMLVLGAISAALTVTACVTHRGYARDGTEVRVYDVDHRDYHPWNDGEVVYYQRWEADTHREHRDFNRRDKGEQREYWTWRHAH